MKYPHSPRPGNGPALQAFVPILVLALALALPGLATAFDIEAFERLDRAELRAAEANMDDYLEPGTAELLREPENAAERYVAEREQRLAEQVRQPVRFQAGRDGRMDAAAFWPLAQTTEAFVDEQGQVQIRCQPLRNRLGGGQPDFRDGNQPGRPVR